MDIELTSGAKFSMLCNEMSCNLINPRDLAIHLEPKASWWNETPIDFVTSSVSDMMMAAVHAAKSNLTTKGSENIGGPFGAAFFQPKLVRLKDGQEFDFHDLHHAGRVDDFEFADVVSWEIFSLGSNLVVQEGRSELHAEVVAGQFAAERLKRMKRKDSHDFWQHWLVAVCTSAPCNMCLNYFTWCSPRAVISGTTIHDTMTCLSLHEGRKPGEKTSAPRDPMQEDWINHLTDRGTHVVAGVERERVIDQLFKPYTGPIYNSGKDNA